MSDKSMTLGPYRIVPPGGPAGPFYGLINGRGNVVALQIVGEGNARFLASSWEMWEQLVALWNNPAVLAALDDEQLAVFQKMMINE